MWKGKHYNYGNSTWKAGITGIQLKVVYYLKSLIASVLTTMSKLSSSFFVSPTSLVL